MAQIQNPRNLDFTWKTDTTKYNIDVSEIQVVLPKGSFPRLDYMPVIAKKEALKFFYAKEPVIAVDINGDVKAYPLNMLTVHEISNDALDGVPILVTYCPLCNAGVVYDRRVTMDGEEKELHFSVSGMLRKSDMVMMDVGTESLWQQLMGEAIVGDYTGTYLDVIPSLIVSVEEFFERYPDGWIIDPSHADENSQKSYGKNYYEGYDGADNKPYERFFNADDVNPRLPAMERVIDIQVDEKYKIYPLSVLAKKKVIHDEFNGVKVVLFYQQGTVSILDAREIRNSKAIGTSTIFSPILDGKELSFTKKGAYFVDEQSGSKWDITGLAVKGQLKGKQLSIEPHSNHFAFAWLGFFPESEIYGE